MATFSHEGRRVPAVTADEMRAVDRVAVEEVGLELLQMMENAGRTLAAHALELADDRPVVVLAGAGGNGGGGICAARHLHDHGREVRVLLARPDLEGAPATQRRILDATPVPVVAFGDAAPELGGSLAVDALVGYGLRDAPRGTVGEAIRAVDRADRVLSLDVPSGVDATTGDRPGVAVDPDRTLTLALPKAGLVDVGELFLADIGIPPAVYDRIGVDYAPPFGGSWSVELAVE